MDWIYKPLDWVFSLNEDHAKRLHNAEVKNRDHLKSWTVFTITLPIITFCFVALMNILLSRCISDDWGRILNNGSLSIIAFGIVSSAVSYLVEHIKDGEPAMYDLRKRVMAVSLLLLFVTASLFLFQSLNVVANSLESFHHSVIFLISLLAAVYSIRVGRKMYLLQSSFADTYAEQDSERVDNITNSLESEFGQDFEGNLEENNEK